MKRAFLAVLLCAAGAAQAAAAAPTGKPSQAEISAYRSRAYPVCLRINPLVAPDGSVNADAIEQCWCSLDQLIAEGRIDDLRELNRSNVRARLGPALALCRSPEGATKRPVARAESFEELQRAAEEQIDATRQEVDALVERAERVEAANRLPEPARAEPAGPAWTSPAWLAWSGLPGWALWLIPVFAGLAVLVLLLTRRRGGGRGDLTAPPPSLRGDAGIGPRDRS